MNNYQNKIKKSDQQSLNNRGGLESLHQYSLIVNFERLMNLIALVLKYPGIEEVEEICSLLNTELDLVYSEEEVEKDLIWLQENCFIGECLDFNAPLQFESIAEDILPCFQNNSHRYSEKKTFLRLMKTIRFLVHNPLFTDYGHEVLDLEDTIFNIEYLNDEGKERLSEVLEILKQKLTEKEINKLQKKKQKLVDELANLENDLTQKKIDVDKNDKISKEIKKIKNRINKKKDNIDSVNQIIENGLEKLPLVYTLAITLLIYNVNILQGDDIDESSSFHSLLLQKDNNDYFLTTNQIVNYLNTYCNNLRKDIEKCLKPYKIFSEKPMSNGYFIGTAIFNTVELDDIYQRMILPHKDYVDELIADEIYTQVENRLGSRAIAIQQLEPIRKIGIQSIVDTDFVPVESLAKRDKLKQLEKTIAKSLKIELCLIRGTAKHDVYKSEDETFEAYPLLILFHNIAWYLGFEFANGNDKGKYKFERLDRLKFFDEEQIEKQLKQDNTSNNNEEFDFRKSLKNLNKLYQSCPGIFLGDKEQQQNFLQAKSSGTFEVELWFQNNIYTFILEGMKRYQGIQLTDPRKNEQLNIIPIYKIQKEYASKKYDFALSDLPEENKNERKRQTKLENIFKLDTTKDEQFPNKFKVKFPRWFVRDYDFLRWILGFGKHVKVVKPIELKNEIKRLSQETLLNHVSKEQAKAISSILNSDPQS